MEKGISKTWTPQQEEHYKEVLASCHDFAGQYLTMTIRDLLKYDARTKEGKRAIAKARLRLATATDDDLANLAILEGALAGNTTMEVVLGRLGDLEKARAKARQKRIKKEELECR